MEALPFASWFKDADGKFNQANSHLLNSLNKDLSKVLGKGSKEVFDQEDARLSDEGEQDVYETGKISEATYSRDKHIYKSVNFPVFDSQAQIKGTSGTRRTLQILPDRCRPCIRREKRWRCFWRTCRSISFSPTESTSTSGSTA